VNLSKRKKGRSLTAPYKWLALSSFNRESILTEDMLSLRSLFFSIREKNQNNNELRGTRIDDF